MDNRILKPAPRPLRPARVIPSALAPNAHVPRSQPITAQTSTPDPARCGSRFAVAPARSRALAYCIALAWCGLPLAAQAQAAAPSAWDEPLTLRKSPALQETIPESVRTQLPVFVTGDRISGQTDLNATIEGNAELRRGDTVIRADRLDYNVPEDLAKARRQRAHQPRRQQLRRLGPGFAGGCV